MDFENCITCADEQTIAQPWFEETVFGRFIDEHMAAQYQFHIGRVEQEHNQFRSDPQFAHRIEVARDTLLQDRFEYICTREKRKVI